MDAPGLDRPDLIAVRQAYDAFASAYIAAFGSADKVSAEDRSVIAAWAATTNGPILDAGRGPGHWSAYLRARDHEVEGIDATPAFIAHARQTHPEVSFRVADLLALDLAPDSLGGVLAWFSLIHMDPQEVPGVLRTFATALQPGGSMLIGYFTGPELQAFDHRVVTAWAWPTASIAAAVEQAGLEVIGHDEHRQPNGRTAAELQAIKRR